MSKTLRSLSQSNHRAWTDLLEPYLPHHLRRKGFTEAVCSRADTRKLVPLKDMYILLAEARRIQGTKGDLLAALVVEQEDRHNAVVWIVEELLKEHMGPPTSSQRKPIQLPSSEKPHTSLLWDITMSAEATQHMIESTAFSGSSLDPLTERASSDAKHECLGQIWRSMGTMVLKAADHEPTSARSQSVMTCVHRLLAHLHHVGAIPASIYNYASAKDPSVLQRPPTTHYWSLRMMTVISDTSWASLNATAQGDGSVSPDLSHPGTSDTLTLSPAAMSTIAVDVPPQIWLDFMLWCCVEGGWIIEAAEIVYQMWKRRGDGRQYAVMDFNTLNEQHAPPLPWTARIKAAIRSSRMRETVGGATFSTYSDRIDFLKPPQRTVSSEVVAAIIDGLVSTVRPHRASFGSKHAVVEKHISVCKIMLDRNQVCLGSSSWNSIVLRMFESLSTDPKAPQTSFEPIVSWAPRFLQEPLARNSAYRSNSLAQTYVADHSAMSLGLLSRLLSEWSLKGDLRGSLRIFRRIQDTVDANRRISLEHFPAMVTAVLQRDGEDALVGDEEQAPGLNMQLSSLTLAPFLDLITYAKECDLGNWLLHNNDVDGCIITPSMYADAGLQPSLIRFASAAGDEKLLNSVLQRLEAPIPQAVMRSLLHHQIHRMEWDAVHEVFELLRDGDGLAWDPTDVVALASAVLRAEGNSPSVSSEESDASVPRRILKALFRGHYNTAEDPSRPRDLSQPRMLKQLVRIVASIPSQLSTDLAPLCRSEYSTLWASCIIPTNAFNMLLETAVDLYGSLQGKTLCESWCFLSDAESRRDQIRNSDTEQVVEPNIQTFYTVLRPLSRASIDAGRMQSGQTTQESDMNTVPCEDIGDACSPPSLNDQEQSVVKWGLSRCFELGVPWNTIKQDLPGLTGSGLNSSSTRKPRDPGTENNIHSEVELVTDSKILDATSRGDSDGHVGATKPDEGTTGD
ncbi:MAG: hypothetical protein L6R39_000711 [Caloplaca ligustica]|nr:MAG: hypothetical protein L6R39_000711 [Caloplaca ligustica]